MSAEKLQRVLNDHAKEGWQLKARHQGATWKQIGSAVGIDLNAALDSTG